MNRRSRLVVAGAALGPLTALAVMWPYTSAQAAAPTLQGWWSVTNTSGLGLPAAPPADPTVPADGLLIQGGGPDAPSAYAALSYDLGKDVTADKLTLAVAPNSATTPAAQLQLCPLDDPTFSPEQGGSMDRAPAYSCSQKVAAGPSDDGKTYTLSVAPLVANGVLAVALLPVDPVTRIVLEQPDDSSLTTQTSQSTDFDFDPAPPPASEPPTSTDTGGTGTAPGPVANSAPGPGVPTELSAPEPAVAAQPTPTAAPLAFQPAAASSGAGSSKRGAVVAIIGVLAVATLAWAFAGGSAARGPTEDVAAG